MFLDIILFMFLGIGVGVLTGLIPGLHPNTVFVLILSMTFFLTGVPAPYLLTFIISLAVSNTFTDFLGGESRALATICRSCVSIGRRCDDWSLRQRMRLLPSTVRHDPQGRLVAGV